MQIYLPHRRKHHSFQNNYSLWVGGVDEYCQRDLPAAHKPTAITVSVWVKPIATATNMCMVGLEPKGSGANGGGILFYITSGNKLNFSKGNGAGSFIAATGATSLSASSVWYHAVGTFDTTNGSVVYLDGTSDGTNADTGAIYWTDSGSYPNPAQTYVGAYKSNALNGGATVADLFFSGIYIDEISIWNTALTSTEVQEVYNSGSPGNLSIHSKSANLVSWYRMDDSTHPTVTDSIGGYDLTMVNMESADFITDVP